MDSQWTEVALLHADKWIYRFACELSYLGLRAEPRLLLEWGFKMWQIECNRSPEDVARAEFAVWPH